jgi:hypothetical protein
MVVVVVVVVASDDVAGVARWWGDVNQSPHTHHAARPPFAHNQYFVSSSATYFSVPLYIIE